MSELFSAAVTTLCGWRMRHTPTVGQVLVQRHECHARAKVGATVNNERQWDGQRDGADVVLPQGLGQQLLHRHGVDRRGSLLHTEYATYEGGRECRPVCLLQGDVVRHRVNGAPCMDTADHRSVVIVNAEGGWGERDSRTAVWRCG